MEALLTIIIVSIGLNTQMARTGQFKEQEVNDLEEKILTPEIIARVTRLTEGVVLQLTEMKEGVMQAMTDVVIKEIRNLVEVTEKIREIMAVATEKISR